MSFYHDITLNDDQKKAVAAIELFLKNDDQRIFALKGYAGTGKTTLIKGIYDYIISCGHSDVWLIAPTGKAKMVLQNKTGFGASTIHSLIYHIEEVEDKETGDIKSVGVLTSVKEDCLNAILIVDESSMINDGVYINDDDAEIVFGSGRLLKDLFSFLHIDSLNNNCKIIFVGDDGQLPPVGSNISPAFDKNYLKREFNLDLFEYKLTEVVRQNSNSPILKLSKDIHKRINAKNSNQIKIKESEIICNIKKDEVIDYFDIGWRNKPKKPVMVIAKTNQEVYEYNNLIRHRYFHDDEIHPRDRLMVYRTRKQNDRLYYNGEQLQVESVLGKEIREIGFWRTDKDTGVRTKCNVELKFSKLQIKTDDCVNNVYILENFLNSSSANVDRDTARALWEDFDERYPKQLYPKEKRKSLQLNDPYLNVLFVKYGYALTVHKAQGSESPWVIVDVRQGGERNEPYFRWFYTAITRASERLFFVGNPALSNVDFKNITWEPPEKLDIDDKTNVSDCFAFDDHQTSRFADKFNITKNTIEFFILKNVLKSTQKHELTIVHIEHRDWCEIYLIADKTGKSTAVNIYYNGKNKITSVRSPKGDLINVIPLLMSITGQQFVIQSNSEAIENLADDLKDFVEKFISLGKDFGAKITLEYNKSFTLRFIVIKQDDTGRVDVFYNQKMVIAKYHIVDGTQKIHGLIERILAEISEA